MAMRGAHFAIDDQHLAALRAVQADDALFYHVGENIEDVLGLTEFGAETDKAWGLIHQTLIGQDPCSDNLARIDSALSCVIMGEETLSDSDWFMVNLTSAAKVHEVQGLLATLSRADFEARLRALSKEHACPNIDGEDVDYAGYWFENMKSVFESADRHGRHVIFTVDY